MRHDKARVLLELARTLAGSAEGLTLTRWRRPRASTGARPSACATACRTSFPQMEAVADPPTKRFRIPAGLDGFMQAPTADELAALASAASELAAAGAQVRAAQLRALEAKMLSALRAPARRRIAPDLEALLQAEAIAVQAGPRPYEDETVLGVIREALKASVALRFRYAGGSSPGRAREVIPYGLLFARSNYLVAAEGTGAPPRNWRLDRIADIEALSRAAGRPEGFSLQAYADQSFGIYQDDTEDVVLRLSPRRRIQRAGGASRSARPCRREPDGSVTVSFRASGMRELAWHLFTWGDEVRIMEPESLRRLLVEQLRTALAAHAGADA